MIVAIYQFAVVPSISHVEVLIAAAMLTGVVGALFLGLRAWQHAASEAEHDGRRLEAVEKTTSPGQEEDA